MACLLKPSKIVASCLLFVRVSAAELQRSTLDPANFKNIGMVTRLRIR